MEITALQTTLAHDAGARYRVLSPITGKPTDFYVTIAGIDSKVWRTSKRKQTGVILDAKAAGKLDDVDYDALDVQALVDATISWEGLVRGGVPVECTKENAFDLYSNSPDVVSQLLRFVSDSKNFTKG
jgi:hypothetical protein